MDITLPALDATVPTLRTLITRWRDDPGATYRSWFLWEERAKNFRSIRRGPQAVVREIEAGTFGNAYRGSSLETVVHSIAEQRPLFKGADHAWLWKPKLRIPDIYESPDNQRAFGRFLDACVCCDTEVNGYNALTGAKGTARTRRCKADFGISAGRSGTTSGSRQTTATGRAVRAGSGTGV